jgi:DNA invertase Pin-like site-specific DNA recombinase
VPAHFGGFLTRQENKKIALYARVATHDQQTLPMQLSAMRAYAKCKDWHVLLKTEEVGSGATSRTRREELPPRRRSERD